MPGSAYKPLLPLSNWRIDSLRSWPDSIGALKFTRLLLLIRPERGRRHSDFLWQPPALMTLPWTRVTRPEIHGRRSINLGSVYMVFAVLKA